MKSYRLHVPIVITLPEIYSNEAAALAALSENGAEIIHLRKPQATDAELATLLDQLGAESLRGKLTLHYNLTLVRRYGLGGIHLREHQIGQVDFPCRKSASCHRWAEVKSLMGKVDYVFLSPVFDSVSKAGYRAAFSEEELREGLREEDRPVVVALGGVSPNNIGRLQEYGFEGAACLGSLWAIRAGEIDIDQSVKNFQNLLKAWNEMKS